jgi:glutaredoxin
MNKASNRTMPIIVYSAQWCRDCREAKAFLAKHNIPFHEIDIELTPGAADEVIRNVGKRAIPQFVINGQWVQPYRPGRGFLYKEMSELLGVPMQHS